MVVWRLARSGLAPALVALLFACAPEVEPPAPKGDVVIGGHTYRLPDEAFADGLVDHGPQDQLLLELLVPVKDGVEPATVQLLLTAPRSTNDDERKREVLNYILTDAHINVAYSLAQRTLPFTAMIKTGLGTPAHLVQVTTYPYKSMDTNDVFVHGSLVRIEEFISCNRRGPAVVYPHCIQEFSAPGIAIKASYDRQYLGYWSQIRTFTLSYLQIHKVG